MQLLFLVLLTALLFIVLHFLSILIIQIVDELNLFIHYFNRKFRKCISNCVELLRGLEKARLASDAVSR